MKRIYFMVLAITVVASLASCSKSEDIGYNEPQQQEDNTHNEMAPAYMFKIGNTTHTLVITDETSGKHNIKGQTDAGEWQATFKFNYEFDSEANTLRLTDSETRSGGNSGLYPLVLTLDAKQSVTDVQTGYSDDSWIESIIMNNATGAGHGKYHVYSEMDAYTKTIIYHAEMPIYCHDGTHEFCEHDTMEPKDRWLSGDFTSIPGQFINGSEPGDGKWNPYTLE